MTTTPGLSPWTYQKKNFHVPVAHSTCVVAGRFSLAARRKFNCKTPWSNCKGLTKNYFLQKKLCLWAHRERRDLCERHDTYPLNFAVPTACLRQPVRGRSPRRHHLLSMSKFGDLFLLTREPSTRRARKKCPSLVVFSKTLFPQSEKKKASPFPFFLSTTTAFSYTGGSFVDVIPMLLPFTSST